MKHTIFSIGQVKYNNDRQRPSMFYFCKFLHIKQNIHLSQYLVYHDDAD